MWIYYCKIIDLFGQSSVVFDYDEQTHIDRVKDYIARVGAERVLYWKIEAVTGYIK